MNEELLKSVSSGHKYLKRTGSKGNYKYIYKLEDGSKVSSDTDPEIHKKALVEHVKRLVHAKNSGHHNMSREEMAEHVGVDKNVVHNAITNARRAERRGSAGTHDFEDHHMKEAVHEDPHTEEYVNANTPSDSPTAEAAPSETPSETPSSESDEERLKPNRREKKFLNDNGFTHERGGMWKIDGILVTKLNDGTWVAKHSGNDWGGPKDTIKDAISNADPDSDGTPDLSEVVEEPSESPTEPEAKSPIERLNASDLDGHHVHNIMTGLNLQRYGAEGFEIDNATPLRSYRKEFIDGMVSSILRNKSKGLFTVGFKYLDHGDPTMNGFKKVELENGESDKDYYVNEQGVVLSTASGNTGGYTNITGPEEATYNFMEQVLSDAEYVKDVSPYYDGLMGQPSDAALAEAREKFSQPELVVEEPATSEPTNPEADRLAKELAEIHGIDLFGDDEVTESQRAAAQAVVDSGVKKSFELYIDLNKSHETGDNFVIEGRSLRKSDLKKIEHVLIERGIDINQM